VTAPDVLADMAGGWNRDPAGVALGTERAGVSAALWMHGGDDVREVDNGGTPLDVHVISLQFSLRRATDMTRSRYRREVLR
jgi:hypothetical protein